MASPMMRPSGLRDSSFTSSILSSVNLQAGFRGSEAAQRAGTLALSVEFVAKPEKAAAARMFLPEAVHGALKEVDGFAGCVVLSADQESRLITVITFWTGGDNRKCCHQNERWVKALVSGYVDSCLRVKTLVAHAPLMSAMSGGAVEAETDSVMQECEGVEGNPCVAQCV